MEPKVTNRNTPEYRNCMSDLSDNEHGWWRVLDANFNRCGEGLRVIEDWSRFVANLPEVSRLAKELRHSLHELSANWSLSARMAARDVPADVGRTIKTESETQRPDDTSFLQANFYRVQQSLRVLEETSKRLQFSTAPALEQLRYRSYELQQRLLQQVALRAGAVEPKALTADGGEQTRGEKSLTQRRSLLANAQVYALIDSSGGWSAFQQQVQRLVECGVEIIQFRDKRLPDRELWAYCAWAAEHLAPTPVLFIVNDRPDIAAAVRADGVHVGQSELPVAVARQILGPDRLIGLSTHDLEQVIAAHQTSANYLGLGPVFPSQTKGFSEFAGLETLRQCLPALELPTFAIGGIDTTNVAQVYGTGMSRIAVQGALGPGILSHEQVARLRKK